MKPNSLYMYMATHARHSIEDSTIFLEESKSPNLYSENICVIVHENDNIKNDHIIFFK